MIITQTHSGFVIQFNYQPHLVDAVKRIPGKRFNASTKQWEAPLHARTFVEAFAHKYRFKFNQADTSPEQYNDIEPLPELSDEHRAIIEGQVSRKLYPFQESGTAYALKQKRVIVGDDMGLGKTLQAICTVIASGQLSKGPCLIICPSSLKLNWQREIESFTTYKAMILDDKYRFAWPRFYQMGVCHFFIVNYESLKKFFVEKIDPVKKVSLKHVHFYSSIDLFKFVIVDESHRVKQFGTQQTRYTAGICSEKEWVLALTGTPVLNKPHELCPQLGIIGQLSTLGGYKKFIDRYCAGMKGASNLKELNFLLNKHCFYRRKKTDVLKDLPSKTRTIVYVDIATRNEYNAALADLENYMKQFKGMSPEQIDKSMKGEVMVRIGILKNIAARGKIAAACEWVKDQIDAGNKISLWVQLHEVADKIYHAFPGCLKITGRETIADRQFAVDLFQNNPDEKLVVCGIQAAGVGITLTAGSTCAFIELGWHAAIMDQCEDRHHRIGQSDNVGCYYFIGKDTIDEWVYSVIESKRAISDQVVGNVDDVERNIVDQYINLFNQK